MISFGKKGQDALIGIAVLVIVSFIISGITWFIFADQFFYPFWFLGWLFLIIALLGIDLKLSFKVQRYTASGAACAVFFVLSWLVGILSK